MCSAPCITCPRIGLNIQLLVAYTGQRSDPQMKVVSAAYEYTSAPWKYK